MTKSTQQNIDDVKVAGAKAAIVLLTLMNLLNYIDRYVPSAVKEQFKTELKLTDAQTAWPLTAFIIVYMIASPIFGSLADRYSRKKLIAVGVVIWSLATASAAFATDFTTFLLARAMVGIGEAAYATIAPSLIGDFFPPARRNRIFTIFYVAIPVGSAMGFVLGGLIGGSFGWRAAFLICGLPGVVIGLLALTMKEPPRGHLDEQTDDAPPPPWSVAFKELAKNQHYVWAVLGYVATTFAIGGVADWFVTFLIRHRGMEIAKAGMASGGAIVVGGVLGTALGGLVAEKLRGRVSNPSLTTCAIGAGPAIFLAAGALFWPSATGTVVLIGLTLTFLFMHNAPVNALLVNVVDARMRARAFGLSILCLHLFGDVVSPPLIGLISDEAGGSCLQGVCASGIACRAGECSNLQVGIWIAPVAILAALLLWGYAARTLAPEPSLGQTEDVAS